MSASNFRYAQLGKLPELRRWHEIEPGNVSTHTLTFRFHTDWHLITVNNCKLDRAHKLSKSVWKVASKWLLLFLNAGRLQKFSVPNNKNSKTNGNVRQKLQI